MLDGHAAPERLRDDEGALGVDLVQPRLDFLVRQRLERGHDEAVHAHFQRAHGLEHGLLEAGADGHDLAGGLHLRADVLVGVDELVKRPARELEHDVVERRLGAGVGLSGHAVDDLVEVVAQRDAGGHLGDGVAGRLRGERGGAGHARVDLDDVVAHAVRVERVLHVAAALDAQRGDDVQRRAAQHLVLRVAQRLARRDDDGVAGVHADRVEVLHVADGDAVARAVADDLVLDLLPAGDAALDEVFVHAGGAQAVRADFAKLAFVLRDAAAGAAQRIGRAHDDRVAVLVREIDGRLDVVHDHGVDARLADGEHHVLEVLAVLGAADGVDLRAQQLHVVLLEDALFIELHREVQAGLAAQRGEQAVRPLARNDLFQRADGQRLEVHLVRDVGVGHDGGRVGVDEHHLHALLLEDAAGLRAGVVKLCRLADDDGAGADHQHLFDPFLLRHCARLRSCGPSPGSGSRRTGSSSRAGRRRPPGGTARRRRSCQYSARPRRSGRSS